MFDISAGKFREEKNDGKNQASKKPRQLLTPGNRKGWTKKKKKCNHSIIEGSELSNVHLIMIIRISAIKLINNCDIIILGTLKEKSKWHK